VTEFFHPIHGGRETAEKGEAEFLDFTVGAVKRAEIAIFRGHHRGPIHWGNRVSARHLLGRRRRVQKPLIWIAFGTLRKMGGGGDRQAVMVRPWPLLALFLLAGPAGAATVLSVGDGDTLRVADGPQAPPPGAPCLGSSLAAGI
jgi:hypothetical protein